MDLSEIKHLPKTDHEPAELDGVSRRILRAAALIEKHGHCQRGTSHDGQGRMCVIAALADAGSEGGSLYGALKRLEPQVPEVDEHKPMNKVARWSDGTPTIEVLAKLRAVALTHEPL
jgi:hypothetical protein